MDELKKYLDDHKGFRLTKEIKDRILAIVDSIENEAYDFGVKTIMENRNKKRWELD